MDGVQLSQGHGATARTQFTFYHQVSKKYLVLWKDGRLSASRNHPVVLNLRPLDSEYSTLTTRPLLQLGMHRF